MKRIWTILSAALLVGLLISPAWAGYYWFQVKDEQGRPVTSGFRAQIYTVASRTADAVFTAVDYGTVRTNPIEPDSNGVITFATSNSTVDVLIYGYSGAARGAVARVNSLTDKDHTIILDTQKPEKVIRFYYDSLISRGAQTDTGIDLPVGAMVFDVWAEVASAVEVASVSVGLLSTEASGDTDGFCVSQGVDTTWGGTGASGTTSAWFRCEASRTTKTAREGLGGHEGYHYSSNTRGVLLSSWSRGQQDIPAAPGIAAASHGTYIEYPHFVRPGAATSIVYQTNDRRAISDRGYAGWIWLFYKELGVKK